MSKTIHGSLCKLIKFLKGAEWYMESFFILHRHVLLLTIFYIIHREFGISFLKSGSILGSTLYLLVNLLLLRLQRFRTQVHVQREIGLKM